MKRVLQRLPYVRYCTTRDDECVLDEVALGLDELDLSKPTRTVEHRLSTKSRHAPRRWPGFMTAAVDTEAPLIPRHINSYSTIPSTWVEFQDQSDEVAKTLSGVPEADPGWKEEARKRFALIKSERSPSVLDAVNYITPETAFKIARRVSRRVCYHAGSVHSSRGWGALTRLKRSKSGVYVSDSWVQAVQVYCMLLEAGVPCNLSTKQICRRQLHARHTVSTLDEVDYQTKVDVGVLDNGDRAADIVDGHLYTAALMGLPAREFHVLGCREGMPMIRQLSEACGDRFLTRGYEDPVQDVGVVQSTSDVIDLGDVVVVDSASTAQLLRTLKHSCGVIHAAMSRDLLVSQVQAFHDKKVDVLLADVDILSSSALFLRASRMVVPDEMHGHSKLHMVWR